MRFALHGRRRRPRLDPPRGDPGAALRGRHWLSADFCTQAHAAEWLGRPLPEPAIPGEPVPTTWVDRVATGVGLSVFFGVIGLFGLGLGTALRFVVGFF